MVDMDYGAEKWCKAIKEEEPEGGDGARCILNSFAKSRGIRENNGFHYFGTS